MSEGNEGNGVLTSLEEMFASPSKRRYKELTLPVSGFKVRIRSITEKEYSAYQAVTYSKRGTGLRHDKLVDANRRFIALCMVDADGNRLLGKNGGQQLSEWDAGDTALLYNECAKHCGINRDDIEDLVGNLSEVHDD